MEGGMVYDDDSRCMKNVLLEKSDMVHCTSSEILDSLWVPNSSPSFHGSASMVNFEQIREGNNSKRPFSIDSEMENCSEYFDGCSHQHEKKRRLTPNQVHFLEKIFEVENKLEPDRKVQLAKELGLQPRQVAIWFQNRRARYKTKLLEKDYDSLKASYDKLEADYDTLYKENERLKNEVNLLREKLLQREGGGKPMPEPCDSIRKQSKKPIFSTVGAPDAAAPVVACKQEDGASSAKSDVFDSDSPHYADGYHSAVLEPTADSSHVFEPEASDFSQDEDDSPGRGLMPPTCFPKAEVESYDDLQPNSCNLGFPVQDQGTWLWQY